MYVESFLDTTVHLQVCIVQERPYNLHRYNNIVLVALLVEAMP